MEGSGLRGRLHPNSLLLYFKRLIRKYIHLVDIWVQSVIGEELFFNKQTVGQHLMKLLDEDPNTSLVNRVF